MTDTWCEYSPEKRMAAYKIIPTSPPLRIPCEVSDLHMGDLFVFKHHEGYDIDYMHLPLSAGQVLMADSDAQKNLETMRGYYIICHHVSLKEASDRDQCRPPSHLPRDREVCEHFAIRPKEERND